MDQPPDDDEGQNGATLLGLLAAIILVVLAVFLLLKLKSGTAMQDCFAQGRRNCAPIDMSQQ